jgi:hypothetical protein
MTSKGGGAGSSTLDAVETGIVLLFNSRVMALTGGWPTLDLVLACCSAYALQFGLGAQLSPTREMHALSEVLKGILLQTVLAAAVAKDLPLYMAHLLCMFLLLHAVDAGGVGATAKYVFASQIAGALSGDPFVGVGVCACLQVNMGLLRGMPRLQECAQLVVVQLVVQWFQSSVPPGLEFATTLLFMHMVSPMLGQGAAGPILTDLYTVALYQVAGTVQLPGAEAWVRAAYAALLWNLATDPVSQLVGQFCCIQVGTAMVLDAGAATLRTDPILAAWLILTGFGVVLLLVR